MAFKVPQQFIIKETGHWLINHRVDSALPGYLMIGSRTDTTNLFDLPPLALADLGVLLAATQKALTDALHPSHIYVGRYGHQEGHSVHFHIIPIYAWVKDAFTSDSRYNVLKSFYTAGAANSAYDGAELTLYVWREFCESPNPPPIPGPSVAESIHLLKQRF
jgi:diadenosine tetraphosphate (Ap4A) HIT family hydrolase